MVGLLVIVVHVEVSTRPARDTVFDSVVVIVTGAVARARVLNVALPGIERGVVGAHEADVDVIARATTVELDCMAGVVCALDLIRCGIGEGGACPGTATACLCQSARRWVGGTVGVYCRLPFDEDWGRWWSWGWW